MFKIIRCYSQSYVHSRRINVRGILWRHFNADQWAASICGPRAVWPIGIAHRQHRIKTIDRNIVLNAQYYTINIKQAFGRYLRGNINIERFIVAYLSLQRLEPYILSGGGDLVCEYLCSPGLAHAQFAETLWNCFVPVLCDWSLGIWDIPRIYLLKPSWKYHWDSDKVTALHWCRLR